MGLWDLAVADNARFMQDESGFARPVTLQSPSGETATVYGLCHDISNTIDPETGAVVAGRYASVAFSHQALQKAGLGTPVAVTRGKPWCVSFTGANGETKNFVVNDVPSDDLGVVTCRLKILNK